MHNADVYYFIDFLNLPGINRTDILPFLYFRICSKIFRESLGDTGMGEIEIRIVASLERRFLFQNHWQNNAKQ